MEGAQTPQVGHVITLVMWYLPTSHILPCCMGFCNQILICLLETEQLQASDPIQLVQYSPLCLDTGCLVIALLN